MKVINIRFEFTDEEWKRFKRTHTEKAIRCILETGALGELEELADQYERQDGLAEPLPIRSANR